MDEIEKWVDIPGYEGRYQVGDLGDVRSLNYNKTGEVKILRPNLTKFGYLLIRLSSGGVIKALSLSRVVCAAFHENPDNLPCVNHIDENKLNNRADNLEWCTYSYNTLYGTHSERMLETRKKKHGEKAEKPVVQLSVDGKEIKKYKSISDAARQTGADRRKISACCNGYREKHFGYKWKFDEETGESVPPSPSL